MRFVVDDQDVPRPCHVPEHVANIGFIALGAALVHPALGGDFVLTFPVERVPVANHDLALPQLVEQSRRHDAESVVVVLRVGRLQDGEAIPDREPRRHHQNVPGEPGVLGRHHLVQDVPRQDHRHDDGFA